MKLNLKKLVYTGWDRNLICADKDAEIGQYSPELKSLLKTTLIANQAFGGLYSEDLKVINLNKYLDYFESLPGSLPLGKTNLCAIIDEKLIAENGIRKEYILLGAY